jgi:hypothetical protein
MARRTRLDGLDHAFPHVTRIGLRHLSPRKGESIPEDSLISDALTRLRLRPTRCISWRG